MKTISIITLLVKISNQEEVPKIVKYDNYILTYDEETQDYYNEPECTYALLNDIHQKLNDEVEIIEDTPKENNIKKISVLNTDSYVEDVYYGELSKEEICLDIQSLKYKINEIIDKINKGEENERNK